MTEKKLQYLFLCLSILAVIPYLYLSCFAHPSADDFTYAYLSGLRKLKDAYVHEYYSWSGRYTANLLVLVNPIAFDSFALYKAIPALMILLTIVSFYFFLKQLLSHALHNTELWIASLLLTLLFIHRMPEIAEGFYWFTGAVTYQLGNIAAMIYIASFLCFFHKNYLLNRSVHFFFNLLMLFIITGFNEILMLILITFHVVIFLISVKHILFILILLCIMFTGNGYGALTDIFFRRASGFDLQMKKRYEIILQSKNTGEENIYIPPVTEPPHCLFVQDITGNPDNWLNTCYIQYFGLKNKKVVRKDSETQDNQ